MLARLSLDMVRLACEPRAQRMDAFAIGFEQRRHRVLCQPIDLQVGAQRAKLPRNRDIASPVTQADGRGEIEYSVRRSCARRRLPACRRQSCRLLSWGRDAEPAIEEIEHQRVALCRAP